jgi:hypothetical protein
MQLHTAVGFCAVYTRHLSCTVVHTDSLSVTPLVLAQCLHRAFTVVLFAHQHFHAKQVQRLNQGCVEIFPAELQAYALARLEAAQPLPGTPAASLLQRIQQMRAAADATSKRKAATGSTAITGATAAAVTAAARVNGDTAADSSSSSSVSESVAAEVAKPKRGRPKRVDTEGSTTAAATVRKPRAKKADASDSNSGDSSSSGEPKVVKPRAKRATPAVKAALPTE